MHLVIILPALLLVSKPIISCHVSCDCSYMSLHYLRNKEKYKKIKIK